MLSCCSRLLHALFSPWRTSWEFPKLRFKFCPTPSFHLWPDVLISTFPPPFQLSLIVHPFLPLVLKEKVPLFLSQERPFSDLARGGVYGCISAVPTHFNVGIFSFTTCAGVAQIVSGFLSEGTAPCIAVDLLYSWEEVSSGTSFVVFFDRNPWICLSFWKSLSIRSSQDFCIFYHRIFIEALVCYMSLFSICTL